MPPPSAGRLRRAARIALTMGLWLAPAALSAQSLGKTTLSFGNQAVNTTSAAKKVVFKNTLLTPVTLTSVSVSGGDAGDFAATPACALPAIIQPGASCAVSVRFTPPVMLVRSSTLIFTHGGPAGPLSAALTGTGVAPVSLAPTSLSFGNVMLGTTSAAKTATLTNALPVALPIMAVNVTLGFVRTGGTCPTGAGILATNASCTILVAFAPTVAGAAPGTLMVSHSGNANPPSISLSGTGLSQLATSPSTVSFSTRTVGTPPSSLKNITVTNKTAAAITLGSPTTSGDFAVASSTCGVLAAGAKCVIGVTFSPTATGGRAGTLSIVYSGVGSPIQITLSGTGNAAGLVSLAVTPANPSIPAGGSVAFAADGTFSDGHHAPLTTSVVWSLTGTPGVAAISNSAPTQGVAQGLDGGTTTVNATLGAIGGATLLTVTSAAPSSINVTPPAPFVGLGLTQQFNATAIFNGGGTSNVTATAAWDLEFPTRGRISANGLYTALASGINTVSAAVGSIVGQAGVTAATPNFQHREQFTFTRLLDGRVLMTGGLDASLVTIKQAEIFDPATGTFTAVPAMSTPRRYHTATLLPDGRVLVAGGVPTSSNNLPIATAEIFDPVLGTWSPTGSMNTNRGYHTATLVGAKVLMAAGYNGTVALASAELYDPSTGSFTYTGSLATPRRFHQATRLSDGLVLVHGGQTPGSPNTVLTSAEIYNPASGSWSTTGSMATARVLHSSTLLPSNLVLAVGGFSGAAILSSAELFNPATGTWAPTGASPLTLAGQSASLLPSGQVLVAGGASPDYRFTTVYDPASGTFQPGPPLAFQREYQGAVVLDTGGVLLVGGAGLQFDPPDGANSAEIRLDGAVMTGLTVEPSDLSVSHPSTIQYRAIGTFSDGSRGDVSPQVTWTISPASVATLSSQNREKSEIRTVGPGIATVRATLGSFSFETTLIVH